MRLEQRGLTGFYSYGEMAPLMEVQLIPGTVKR
jgi:hypothetical protein